MQVPTTGAAPSLKHISKTKFSTSLPATFGNIGESQTIATYESVILANGDVCSVGNWVLVAAGNGCGSAVCRVDEIVSWAPENRAPDTAHGVLLCCGRVGEILDPYCMPAVTATNNSIFLPPSVRSVAHLLTTLIHYFTGSAVYHEHSAQLPPEPVHSFWVRDRSSGTTTYWCMKTSHRPQQCVGSFAQHKHRRASPRH